MGILSIFVFYGIFAFVLVGFILWLKPWEKALSFYEIEDEERTHYVALINRVDALLFSKFLKKLPFKIIVACFTAGIGLFFFMMKYSSDQKENNKMKDAAYAYVKRLKEKYQCGRIAWRTFPSSESIYGLFCFPKFSPRIVCPVCKRKRLQRFRLDNKQEILCCNRCHKTILVNRSSDGINIYSELLIPGILSKAIHFTGGIHDGIPTEDLFDSLPDIIDGFDLFDFL